MVLNILTYYPVRPLQASGETLDHKEASGRMAVGTEPGVPTDLAEVVKKADDGGKIVHGPLVLKPHNEDLVIVGDPDGYVGL